ncbi:MAG: hypothetical protein M1274_12925 [Actinobacteria bacterium]|nr:hypothetical protein [Actinomycetota bacterium]
MSVAPHDAKPIVTEHALLVPCGRFAAEVGLIDALNRVPFKMKTVDHSPGSAISVHFASDSPWRGITLFSKPQVSYQLRFPFLEDRLLTRAKA